MVDCMASSTLLPAPLTAAVIRSCSISRSPAFTISGLDMDLSTCLRPSIFTVTLPPPEEDSDHRLFHLLLQDFVLLLGLRHQFLQVESAHQISLTHSKSPLFLLVDDGPNFCAKLLFHAADHRVLLGPAAPPIAVG